ncbi:hypothetical protein DSO57_1028353 [Entomophthora muscae]|uniref:Uncharacterized protein n=1 Tax=Entomophthora muscae TaxID=34485 RepID=A0ACC2UMB6_9FUNG|nr:hypothetical protein DSO57_1028353 [Entomophthora muscae]
MPDSSKPFFLEADTSDYAVGAILLQHGEMDCSTLIGVTTSKDPVSIFTDHKSLLFFTQARCISQHNACWVIELTNFLFTITYNKGSLNVLLDLLICHLSTADFDLEYKLLNTKAILLLSVFINQISSTLYNLPDTLFIQKAQSEDPTNNKIIQDLISKAIPPSEYSLENNLLLFCNLVLVPNKDLQL